LSLDGVYKIEGSSELTSNPLISLISSIESLGYYWVGHELDRLNRSNIFLLDELVDSNLLDDFIVFVKYN
jgi:hypothetical protein